MANPIENVVRPVDRWQQQNRAAGFVYGVVKKFGDDRGGTLAALVTFYGFLSIFPLLLVATTILGFVLRGNPGLQHSIETSALSQFPVVGKDLPAGHLRGSTFGLVVGMLGLLWGSLGVAQAVQFAINEAWDVPNKDRAAFVPRLLKGFGFFGLLGVGLVGTTALTSLGAIVGNSEVAGGLGLAAAFIVNAGLFLAIFKLMGPRDVAWGEHLRGAVLAGAAWQVLQVVGQSLVRHNLKNTSALYGQFAIVLGLISFLSLGAQLIMYSVEVNVVYHKRLWPRSILQPPLLPADRRSLAARAVQEERRPEQSVDVSWTDQTSAPGDVATDGPMAGRRPGDTPPASVVGPDPGAAPPPVSLEGLRTYGPARQA